MSCTGAMASASLGNTRLPAYCRGSRPSSGKKASNWRTATTRCCGTRRRPCWPSWASVKAIFLMGAGVDALLKFGDALPDVPLVRLGDAGMGVQMAEYVAHAVLRYFRRFDEYEQQARHGAWNPLPQHPKESFTIGVMGLGELGMPVVEAMRHFGFPAARLEPQPERHPGRADLCRHGAAGRLPARHARAGLPAAADARHHQPARPPQPGQAAARRVPDQRGARRDPGRTGSDDADPLRATSPAPRSTCSATSRCRPSTRSGTSRASPSPRIFRRSPCARTPCARSSTRSTPWNAANRSTTSSTANVDIEMTPLPTKVKIVEVGPRDGLQNEKEALGADVKIELVERLARAGFVNVEAAAFVSPKWVPQMATVRRGAWPRIERRPGTIYSALMPNMQGFEAALAGKADEVVVFGSASEAFSQKNINCSIAESIARFEPVARAAKEHGLRLRGSISTAFGCPYQGAVSLDAVGDVVARMRDLGCDEIDIADTIGVATARQTQAVMLRAAQAIPAGPAGRPLPRHVWPGAGEHLRRAGSGRGDFPLVGGGPGRLPVCQGRDRQCGNRGRAVPDAGAGDRDGRGSRPGGRCRAVHLGSSWAARASAAPAMRWRPNGPADLQAPGVPGAVSGKTGAQRKKPTTHVVGFFLNAGRSTRIRTLDPLVPNQVRYRAALHSEEAR